MAGEKQAEITEKSGEERIPRFISNIYTFFFFFHHLKIEREG